MKALAVHESEPEAVETTVEDFARDLGTAVHAALAEMPAGGGGRAFSVALYFFSHSSWTDRALYLQDIFVESAAVGASLGGALVRSTAATAVTTGCRRMQWVVLDFNFRSAEFYEAAGAQTLPVAAHAHGRRRLRAAANCKTGEAAAGNAAA